MKPPETREHMIERLGSVTASSEPGLGIVVAGSLVGLTDAEIDAALDGLHVKEDADAGLSELEQTKLCANEYERELDAANSELAAYRLEQMREGWRRLEQIQELQNLLGQEAYRVGAGLREIESRIKWFQEQIDKDQSWTNTHPDSQWAEERDRCRAYVVAHRAAVDSLRAVKRALEGK